MTDEQAERAPVEETESVAPTNPEQMTDEDLLSAVQAIEDGVHEEPEQEDPLPAAEPETAEEVVQEQVAESAETPAEESEEEIPDDISLLREEMQLRFDKEQAERQKWEYIAQRRAGEEQFERKSQRELPRDEYTDEPAVRDVRDEIRAAVHEETAPLRQSAVNQAIAEELNAIQQRRPDFMEHSEAIGKLVQERMPEIQSVMQGGDAKVARVLTKSLLEGAYADVRLTRLDALREQTKQRKADQAARLVSEKRAASISGSSTAPAAPVSHSPKDPRNMTDAELLAEVRAIERSPG